MLSTFLSVAFVYIIRKLLRQNYHGKIITAKLLRQNYYGKIIMCSFGIVNKFALGKLEKANK